MKFTYYSLKKELIAKKPLNNISVEYELKTLFRVVMCVLLRSRSSK